jgi:hypothetical protein
MERAKTPRTAGAALDGNGAVINRRRMRPAGIAPATGWSALI